MSPELEKKIFSNYSTLFRERNGSPKFTAMCWGFECGDGWYSLIDSICEYIMADVSKLKSEIELYKNSLNDNARIKDELEQKLIEAEKNLPVVIQVKEKFGGLRFYVHGATESQCDYIHFVERMSYRICEDCGTTKDVITYNVGWTRTLCPEHADVQYGTIAADYRNGTGDFANVRS